MAWDMDRRIVIAFLISILIHLFLFIPLPFSSLKEELSKIKKNQEPLSIEFIHQKPTPEENEKAKRLSYETHVAKRETTTRRYFPFEGSPLKKPMIAQQDERVRGSEEKEEGENPQKEIPQALRGLGGPMNENLPEEETVNLNTREFKYISYFSKIKSKIELVWTYPQVSVMNGEQGTVHLKFTIVEDGSLEDVQLIKSSGYPALDEEAIRAVKAAAPYPPLPKSWGLKRLHIIGEFNYILGYRIIR
jgi:protein TonB